MKLTYISLLVVILFTLKAQAQISPQKKMTNPNAAKVAQEASIGTKTATVAFMGKKKFESENGDVSVSFERNKAGADNTKTTTSESKAAMCLTKEEVRGQKIENELQVADGSKAQGLVPGVVIDGEMLLKSGEFNYQLMKDRKPISLYATSNLVKKTSAAATAPGKNNSIEEELFTKVNSLKSPGNFIGMPNLSSTSEMYTTTLMEANGLNIGASFFYMGFSAKSDFGFSSKKYKYMYLYKFEQNCVTIRANEIDKPADVFTTTKEINNNYWMYVREVTYGRRLYVIVESEYDLMKYNTDLKGNMSWGVVSAKFAQSAKGSSFSEKTNIRAFTQGGQLMAITDKSKVQQELDKYFKSKFNEIDIVPMAYKMTYLDGTPVSLVSEAFLNGNNCLDKNNIKVRLTKIECKKADDNKQNEEVYGGANIFLFNEKNIQVMGDGKTPAPAGINFPTGSVTVAIKDAPIVLNEGGQKEYGLYTQGKYVEFLIANLDFDIQIKPFLKEKDNGFNADDSFITDNIFKKSLRSMLLEGSNTPVFEFRRKNTVITLHFEIMPVY
jgi:hypothetical protein